MIYYLLVLFVLGMPSGRFITQVDGFLEPEMAFWQKNGNIAVFDRMADEVVVINIAGERLEVIAMENTTQINELIENQIVGEPLSDAWNQGNQIYPLHRVEFPDWPVDEIRKPGNHAKTLTGWVIPDELGHAIHHYDLDGHWLGKWGVHAILPHEGGGKLHYPNAVDVSPDGTKILVCEGFEGRIQIFELGEGEPESPPLISNIAHFGKHVDSYGDLILIAEPELGDVYLLRTGLDVPIELTRFGGEGDAPHQFKWINELWIGDGEIQVVDGFNLKTFTYEHDPSSPLKMVPGMVRFQKSQERWFLGAINTSAFPFASDLAMSQEGNVLWLVNPVAEEVTAVSVPIGDLLDQPHGELLVRITGFIEPQGIEIESDGNILVSDIGASNIKRFSPEGELLLTFGEKGFAPHQMFKPAGITSLDDGTIVVVDWGNHRAQLYSKEGKWQATFGRGRSWTRAKNPPVKTVTSSIGNWTVTFSPHPDDMKLNEIFELTTKVEGSGEIKSLRVDAAMPAHGHGMMTNPVTTKQPDGSFKTTGMLLSMPGDWELYFDIHDGETIERAQTEVTLSP